MAIVQFCFFFLLWIRISDLISCWLRIYSTQCSFSLLTNSSATSSAVWWITSSNGKSSRFRRRSHFGHGRSALRHSAWNTALHSSHCFEQREISFNFTLPSQLLWLSSLSHLVRGVYIEWIQNFAALADLTNETFLAAQRTLCDVLSPECYHYEY